MEHSSLSRTTSNESTRSQQLLAFGNGSLHSSRKARSSDAETGIFATERSSVSMPPPAAAFIRRASRASAGSIADEYSSAKGIPAPDDTTTATTTTPTPEGPHRSGLFAASTLVPEAFLHRTRAEHAGDADSSRLSFSSLYSLGSVIMSNALNLSGSSSVAGSEPEGRIEGTITTTATSSVSVTASSQHGSLNVSPTQQFFAKDQVASPTTASPNTHATMTQPAASPQPGAQPANAQKDKPQVRRSRSRTAAQRRISGSHAPSSSPGSRDVSQQKKPTKGIIGVCALESKARSKPARNIFGKWTDEFEVKIFGDKIILDEDVANWPVCDFLISFFSDGFPLDKAIAYARLRKPFCVNDLPMQQVIWDRRLCLQILDRLNVPTPARLEVSRDGGPKLQSGEFARALCDRTGVSLPGPADGTGGGRNAPKKIELIDNNNTLVVDGVTLTKPFVEKPVSGEDHNINIYYHSDNGGGGRRLFRKVNNKSSEKDDTLDVPRSITDPTGSYIYEQFLQVENAEDVKAYTVGPNFCHAETRKSPVVDGLVKRNPSGKEVRYVTKLSDAEASMASRISEGFGQRVCGFDLLRCGNRSYVIDVNGWSFVKDNSDYYDKAARILKEMFLQEIQRKERKESQAIVTDDKVEPAASGPRKMTGTHRQALKGLFKSPSIPKLHGHANHLRSGQQSSAQPSSPDSSLGIAPISPAPSFEKSGPTSAPSLPNVAIKSDPELLPEPAICEKEELQLETEGSLSDDHVNVPPPASKAQWKLKGIVSVIRHADRTPKQKFKYTFHTQPFVDLLKGHQEEVLLIGEAALQSVSDAVRLAMDEGIEDAKKLQELSLYLSKKGSWPGTKVQIKPMFRKRRKEELLPWQTSEDTPELQRVITASAEPEPLSPYGSKRSDSMSGVTLSRISAAENNLILDKLQLIIKWGGEPTHSARHQAQDMAHNFRNDLQLMNKEILEDVSIFSSSERRVTASAQIFASKFLDVKEFSAENIHIRKDLLDDSNAAKDVMDKVKKKLKTLLRAGDKAPPQFVWPKDVPEPYLVVRQVVDLMKFHQRVMNYNFKKIQSGAVTSLHAVANPSESTGGSSKSAASSAASYDIEPLRKRWCCNEGPELFKERWEKLFKEFHDADKVDPSKISELYDTMKFDALHNRAFLEWVFTPDSTFLEEDSVVEGSSSGKSSSDIRSKQPSPTETPAPATKESATEKTTLEKSAERPSMAHRMGFRRKSEIAPIKPVRPPIYPHESYFKLFTGSSSSASSKAQVDARLTKLRDMYHLCKVLFDYIGPQEYGIDNEEKLEIGLLTSLPLLKEIVEDLEELQASDMPKSFFYFTKESHIYTLLNCILEGGIKTKIERNAIPELDYLSQIGFELYESEDVTADDQPNTFNYSIRITLSPGCHAFAPLDVQLDSRHMIGFSPRRSLTAHHDWKEVLETLRAKFHTVKLPKSFVAINLSEKVPGAFGLGQDETPQNIAVPPAGMEGDVLKDASNAEASDKSADVIEQPLPSPAIDVEGEKKL